MMNKFQHNHFPHKHILNFYLFFLHGTTAEAPGFPFTVTGDGYLKDFMIFVQRLQPRNSTTGKGGGGLNVHRRAKLTANDDRRQTKTNKR